ncbi:MAG: hypothetical protein ACI8RD_000322 [Bacillariaceae sp.]|jgi:hypothetical protein
MYKYSISVFATKTQLLSHLKKRRKEDDVRTQSPANVCTINAVNPIIDRAIPTAPSFQPIATK